MSTTPEFDEVAENLSFLDDWEDRYRYIIELGQELPPLSEEEKNSENRVHGCTAQVWLVTEATGNTPSSILNFRGESDALIVKGLVSILLKLYSGLSAKDIAALDAMPIIDSIGLREHLSTQRSNGLISMIQRIRADAQAIL